MDGMVDDLAYGDYESQMGYLAFRGKKVMVEGISEILQCIYIRVGTSVALVGEIYPSLLGQTAQDSSCSWNGMDCISLVQVIASYQRTNY
jgi:hypothetical protein